MTHIQRCLVLPAAIVAMIAMSSTAAAQCDNNAVQGSIGDSSAAAGGYFNNGGWPGGCQNGNCGSGGCGAGGCTSLFGLQEGFEKYKADFHLNHARNTAWPLPFSCWDREAYHSIFNVSYHHGLQTAHMLTSDHFNPETNELNRAGESRVSWIMQKASQANKQIFVYEDKSGPTMEQRMSAIRNFTERYYAHMGGVQIAKSNLLPNKVQADYIARTMADYRQEVPSQRIPVQVGASLQSSVGGGN